MDDLDPEALTGAVDTVKPWTIKSVPTEIRDLAIMSARKEGLTVSQWLERRIRTWHDEQSAEVDPSSPLFAQQSAQSRPADQILAVERMVNLAQEVASLSPELQKDPVMRAARGTLKAVLHSLRPAANHPANPARLADDTGKPAAG